MTDATLPPEDSTAILRRAAALQAEGDEAAACELYRRAVGVDANSAIAWALLGGCLLNLGDGDAARDALDTAHRLAPRDDEIAVEYAVVLQAVGRAAEAIEILAGRMPRLDESDRAHAVLADALAGSGRPADAIAHFRQVLALSPGNNAARIALGACQQQLNDLPAAIATYRAALDLDPGADEAWSNLGLALAAQGQLAEAVTALETAVSLLPDDPATRCNLGTALQKQGRIDDAAACFEGVIAAHPGYADALSNLGNVRQEQRRLGDAMAAHDRAVTLAPDHADIHWNRAMTLLLSGDLSRGFAEYEWRVHTVRHAPPRHSSPRWDGGDIAGRHILLLAEQGFGDAIQFVRYAPLLQARGARVTIQCAAKLAPLFATLDGAPAVIAHGQPLPEVDCHAPLMSLPHLLGTTLDTVPGDTPYLHPPAGAAAPPEGVGKPRIGLCWSGSPDHPDNAWRSCPAAALAPLLTRRDVDWISLQFGPGAGDFADRAHQPGDWSPYLNGFGDTAAALQALDLVITVDTATAHLAAALGRPVWLMLKFAPDWRWMLDRDDSPWYPTMRLFRQEIHGDWTDVVRRLRLALDRWIAE